MAADMDDDVQSDSDIVDKAKMGLMFDLKDAVRKFCGDKSTAGRARQIKNLQEEWSHNLNCNVICLD